MTTTYDLASYITRKTLAKGGELTSILIRFGMWLNEEGYRYYDDLKTMHRSTTMHRSSISSGWTVRSIEGLFNEFSDSQMKEL